MHLIDQLNRFCTVVAFLIQFLPVLFAARTNQLSYEDIISLGASCSPSDTCSIPRQKGEDSLSLKTCVCKSICAKYGTCCIDSPNLFTSRSTTKSTFQQARREPCLNLIGTNSFIYAVNRCRPFQFVNQGVRALCEDSTTDLKDPIAALPVTSTTSSITYKNYYCALCNNALRKNDLIFWNIRIEKPTAALSQTNDESSILGKLAYDSNYDQWGIMNDDTTNNQFDVVSLAFDYPTYIHDKINSCVPDLVTDCHPAWTDNSVRYKCLRYMGMVYATSNSSHGTLPTTKRFRNIHCAICNFAYYKPEDMCYESFHAASPERGRPALSFSLLLDINPTDGERVGEVTRCGTGELYDPFFKKCRAMVCATPGYKVTNGKCVPS